MSTEYSTVQATFEYVDVAQRTTSHQIAYVFTHVLILHKIGINTPSFLLHAESINFYRIILV
jgi:hypothetical protein